MSTAKFTSISQLTVYLTGLEARLDKLEYENESLRDDINRAKQENLELRQSMPQPQMDIDEKDARKLLRALPETGLLSRSFITRAFTVWGHYFVAQLIISLGIFAVYVVVAMLLLGGLQGR